MFFRNSLENIALEKAMTMITETSIMSFVLQTVLAYHGAMYGYYHDREQRYYPQPDSYNYDWPKRHIRKLRPRRNRIHHIGERYRIDTDSSADCECSCNDCVLPKLCCVPTCATCAVHTDILYIPYPFPIIVTMPNNAPMYPSTTKSTTKFTTKLTTQPRTESTTAEPYTPPSTYVPSAVTSPATSTTRLRPTMFSTVKPQRKLTVPPGAPGSDPARLALYAGEYDDNAIFQSTQPPKTTKKWRCPRSPACVYRPNKYQGLMANRRALYGRRRTSDWFSNIERSLRRTTQHWLPKYGIVSIPDHLARFFVEDQAQYDSTNIRQ